MQTTDRKVRFTTREAASDLNKLTGRTSDVQGEQKSLFTTRETQASAIEYNRLMVTDPKDTKKALDSLLKALETGMYDTPAEIKVSNQLKDFLSKLGIKSAKRDPFYGGALKIESLESVLKSVTFDDTALKNWSKLGTKSQSQPIASGGGPSDCTSARKNNGK